MAAFCGIASGSHEGQTRDNCLTEQSWGNTDGWVSWCDHRPKPDVPVECKREGEDEIYPVTPREMSLEWNIAGVYWRTPRVPANKGG